MSSTPDKLDSIQLLRALAATAVVVFHIPLFRNGAWGVDIFFVISGFIIALVTEKSSRHFFAKRIIRVVPLYWLGTFGVFGVACLMPNLLDNTTADITGLIKSLFFIPYLKGEYAQPLLYLGWTLNFEMFFYALFAVAMAISHRHRLAIASAMILALVLLGQLVAFESVVASFYTSEILAEFALGLGCYALYKRTARWRAAGPSRSARRLLVVTAVTCLGCMPFSGLLDPLLGRAGYWGIPATLAFLALVHGLSGVTLPRSVVLIGDASYSLYLFHPYVLKTFNKVFHIYDLPGPLPYLLAPLAILVCFMVAVALYRLVEHPLTQWLRVTFLEKRHHAPLGSGALDQRAPSGPPSDPTAALRATAPGS